MAGARHIHNIGATAGSRCNLRIMVGMTYGHKIYYIHCMVMHYGYGLGWRVR